MNTKEIYNFLYDLQTQLEYEKQKYVETLDLINQEKENEIHIPPNGGKEKYSQGQIYCLHAFNAKRFKTNSQKEEVANLEIIHGLDLLKKGIDWGAVRGMSMGGTIIALKTALPNGNKKKGNNGVNLSNLDPDEEFERMNPGISIQEE